MPYDGGEIKFNQQSRGVVLSTEETINFWKEENKCKEKVIKKDVSNTNTFDETRSEKFIYNNCENDSKVELITVNNGGHSWPGGRQYLGERFIGKTSKDFDASKEIWKFFKGL